MVLIVDNSGFTASITAAMIRSLGYGAAVLPCTTDYRSINITDYGAVILTAGPGNLVYETTGWIIAAQQGGVPLLGVCQGMELIVRHNGGVVAKSVPVMCEDTLSHSGEGLFRGICQRFRVVLRQSHTIDRKTLPQSFEAEAYSSNGSVQAVSILNKKVYGTAFDPSNYRTEHGIKILYNFLTIS